MPRHFSRALLGFIPIALIGAPVLSIFVPLALAGTKTPGVVASSTSDASRDTALQQNCVNVANVATAARMAFQEKKLSELEQRLEHKLTEIQTRRQELKELLDRYDAFTNKADDTVIDIFQDEAEVCPHRNWRIWMMSSAAAILIKLRPKSSSAILNEMDTFHASCLPEDCAFLVLEAWRQKAVRNLPSIFCLLALSGCALDPRDLGREPICRQSALVCTINSRNCLQRRVTHRNRVRE